MLDFKPEHCPTPEIERLQDFNELVVFHNPGSTKSASTYKRAMPQLEAMCDVLPIELKRETTSEFPEETAKKFFRTIKDPANKKTAVVTISGDGGHGQLVQILQNPDTPDEFSQIPLGNIGGGNGHNWFSATIAQGDRKKSHNIVTKGVIRSVFPIECLFTPPDQDERRLYAATHLGINATAHAIERVNRSDHRDKKLRNWPPTQTAIDGLALLRGLFAANKFKFQEEEVNNSDTEDPELVEASNLYELSFFNAPRAGVIYVPGVKLSGPIHRVEVKHKNPFEVGYTWARLASTKLSLRLSPGHDLLEPYSFTVLERPLAFQADGESKIGDELHVFEEGTQVRIQRSTRPLRVITTKKRI